MLRLFRNIRQRLFLRRPEGYEGHVLEGWVSRYFGYAVGEIVLIVVGILLALQISEWNQGRKDRAEETEILLRLKGEMTVNQTEAKRLKAFYRNTANEMRDFLDLIKPDPEPLAREELINYVRKLWISPEYSPSRGVWDTLIASGKIGLIENDLIITKLNAWSSSFGVYEDTLKSRDINIERYKVALEKYYGFRDAMLMPEDWMRPLNPSNFNHDSQVLLAMPELENAAEFARLNLAMLARDMEKIETLQNEVISLIDAELAERGM